MDKQSAPESPKELTEQSEQPQPEQPALPVDSVPNSSAGLSPSSSSPPLGASGNIPSNHSHRELPLAQHRKTRANDKKPPVWYGFKHDIANFILYSPISLAYKAFITSFQIVHVPKD